MFTTITTTLPTNKNYRSNPQTRPLKRQMIELVGFGIVFLGVKVFSNHMATVLLAGLLDG
ncbi:hypothetical protein [Acaryochloris sp. IP29b_bin.137]|uniref:hypothetical protein n=1 Tax=Acaryochloris sp. IP29b_bin.137 TaxID=2969217 RepID=UPI0026295904|nr:hypothetical protein [Acaryochloris sp. IP29b_bin.137]